MMVRYGNYTTLIIDNNDLTTIVHPLRYSALKLCEETIGIKREESRNIWGISREQIIRTLLPVRTRTLLSAKTKTTRLLKKIERIL